MITLSSVTVDGHSGTYKCNAAYNSIGTAASPIRNLHVIGMFQLGPSSRFLFLLHISSI